MVHIRHKLSKRSLRRLQGVHPDLVRVVKRASTILRYKDDRVDFSVGEGVRTLARQKELYAKRASQTMNSRHLVSPNGFSHAVDLVALVGGQVTWSWEPYFDIAEAMKQAALELNIPIEWGGDWKSFRDGPHFQLPWSRYNGRIENTS